MKMKRLFIYPALLFVMSACNNDAEKQAELDMAQSQAIDTLSMMEERARLEDSLESLADATIVPAPLPPEPAGTGGTKPAPKKGGAKKDNPTTSSEPKKEDNNTAGTSTATSPNTGGTSTVSGNETAGNEPKGGDAPAPEEKKKKGINNTVKGAIIGAGAGAVGGAIINKKNPGKGAIIGGVVGAGAGAVTGVILDRNKKKREAKDTAGTSTSSKEPDGTKP
jgi:hypothetical protein